MLGFPEYLLEFGFVVIATGIGLYILPISADRHTRRNRGPGGLVNPGNTCFMNSVIQSLVSLNHLNNYISKCDLDYQPVTRAMRNLQIALSQGNIIKPVELQNALMDKGGGRHLLGYFQQDAHELFQVLSSFLTDEEPPLIHRGIVSLFDIENLLYNQDSLKAIYCGKKIDQLRIQLIKSPLTGLVCSMITCLTCGYMTSLRHEVFDNLSTVVPQSQRTNINYLLQQYIQPEIIHDYTCDKCSVLATYKYYLEKLMVNRQEPPELEFLKKIIKLKDFDVEFPLHIKKIKQQSIVRKNVYITSPPKSLCLHMQRSIYTPSGYVTKNHCFVDFPMVLDMSKYATQQAPSTWKNQDAQPFDDDNQQIVNQQTAESQNDSVLNHTSGLKGGQSSISEHSSNEAETDVDQDNNFLDQVQDIENEDANNEFQKSLDISQHLNRIGETARYRYHLSSVILHYGSHDSGHFVTLKKDGNQWYRISDETVTKIRDLNGIGQQVYMLFYESEI